MKYKEINKQNIWVEKISKKNFENTPCLFLDRDGVLIDWKDYTMKSKDAILIKGCEKVIKVNNTIVSANSIILIGIAASLPNANIHNV